MNKLMEIALGYLQRVVNVHAQHGGVQYECERAKKEDVPNGNIGCRRSNTHFASTHPHWWKMNSGTQTGKNGYEASYECSDGLSILCFLLPWSHLKVSKGNSLPGLGTSYASS